MLPIERLLLVAAPSCCGKSTFIRGLRSGELADWATTLRFQESDGWLFKDAWYLDPEYLDRIREAPESNMVLHWTIPRPSIKLAIRDVLTGGRYDKANRIDFVRSTGRLTIVTLLNSREFLLRGVASRLETAGNRRRSGKSSQLTYWRQRWNMARLRALYSNMANLVPMYDRWFEFCESLSPESHEIIQLDKNFSGLSVDDWSTLRLQWLESNDE
jgi:hypothetical protein